MHEGNDDVNSYCYETKEIKNRKSMTRGISKEGTGRGPKSRGRSRALEKDDS